MYMYPVQKLIDIPGAIYISIIIATCTARPISKEYDWCCPRSADSRILISHFWAFLLSSATRSRPTAGEQQQLCMYFPRNNPPPWYLVLESGEAWRHVLC